MTVPNKALERHYLDAARSVTACLPAGPPVDFESPDFLIASSQGLVGVEITRFSWPQNVLPEKPGRIQPAHIQRVLNRKARRLRGYWLPGHRVWLVIVLDRRFPSCAGELADDVLSASYRSPFASTVVLDLGAARSVTLANCFTR